METSHPNISTVPSLRDYSYSYCNIAPAQTDHVDIVQKYVGVVWSNSTYVFVVFVYYIVDLIFPKNEGAYQSLQMVNS